MSYPQSTRLRYVSAKRPEELQQFVDLLGKRIEIKGSPVWTGKRWYLWFVPDDRKEDVKSIDL